jgi:NADPH2:quinone reductase
MDACGRPVFIVGSPALERNISADAFAADVNHERLDALNRLVEEGKLRVAVKEVFPLDQVRDALERVAGGHTRGKIVLTVG